VHIERRRRGRKGDRHFLGASLPHAYHFGKRKGREEDSMGEKKKTKGKLRSHAYLCSYYCLSDLPLEGGEKRGGGEEEGRGEGKKR